VTSVAAARRSFSSASARRGDAPSIRGTPRCLQRQVPGATLLVGALHWTAMDHDRLFKELLSTFFVEFVELFFPEMATYLDARSVTFPDKELFTDVTSGTSREADSVARAEFAGKRPAAFFLVHVEAQARDEADFPARMCRYFFRLHHIGGDPATGPPRPLLGGAVATGPAILAPEYTLMRYTSTQYISAGGDPELRERPRRDFLSRRPVSPQRGVVGRGEGGGPQARHAGLRGSARGPRLAPWQPARAAAGEHGRSPQHPNQ